MPVKITHKVEGLDELIKDFEKMPAQVRKNMKAAGREAQDEVLGTVGVKQYPPAHDGNAPPPPYYIRGRGTQTASGNLGNSERYGSQWSVDQPSDYKTEATNTASYAGHLAEEQPAHIARRGWRTWLDVATEKKSIIENIFKAWLNKIKLS